MSAEPAGARGGATIFQMARYLLVGGLSTLVDWGVYYLLAIEAGWHYQASLLVSQLLAATTHYSLNKVFTFRCTSRQIIKQIAAHALVSAVYLLASMGVMYLLVDVLAWGKMLSRFATTGVMILASYYLHRTVTFNERFFAREAPAAARQPQGGTSSAPGPPGSGGSGEASGC